jgi:hypothetical protein
MSREYVLFIIPFDVEIRYYDSLMATYLLVGLLMLHRFVMRCWTERCLVLEVGGLRRRVNGPMLIKRKCFVGTIGLC